MNCWHILANAIIEQAAEDYRADQKRTREGYYAAESHRCGECKSEST